MLPLKIKIPNLLPPEIAFQVLSEPGQVHQILADQGWANQATGLSNRVTSRIKDEPLENWIEWDGYFTDKGNSLDLGIFGVLYCNGATFLRGIFVPDVPKPLLAKVQPALPQMNHRLPLFARNEKCPTKSQLITITPLRGRDSHDIFVVRFWTT